MPMKGQAALNQEEAGKPLPAGKQKAVAREQQRSLLTPTIKRMREARHRSGLSYRDLAAKSGVYWTLIYRIEHGVVKHPRAETLEKIGQALGVSLLPAGEPVGPTQGAGVAR